MLDILMPEPGGLEVCRAIRARGDDIPILMLTARDLVSDRVAGLDAGADDYLASRSRSRNCGRGCARCCGAAARAPTCSGSPVSSSMSRHTRQVAAVNGCRLPRPNSRCSNCSCATRAGCFPGPRYSNRCGGMTSARNRTRCGSMSAICAGRWGIRIRQPTGWSRSATMGREFPRLTCRTFTTALPVGHGAGPARLGPRPGDRAQDRRHARRHRRGNSAAARGEIPHQRAGDRRRSARRGTASGTALIARLLVDG